MKGDAFNEKELREKRARGLCFNCDEPWSFNHACKNRELRVILTEEEREEIRETNLVEKEQPLIDIDDPMAGITLQFIIGFTKPKTMKLEGEMAGTKVINLIDSGATNNFISSSTARKLGLKIAKCKQFGLTFGTRFEVFGKGICRKVSLWVQGIEICDNFFVLELGSLDIILGVQWLETLGPVTTN